MDGHANGTEDEDELIEMTVSDIPFNNYDVVIYMGSQSAQFGDGTGKIVFSGAEQGFTLTSGAFDGTFTEIVDAGTPGNYILYKGLKDSSFTVMVRGNGFNHIGPCGFQFREAHLELAGDPSPADESTDVPRDDLVLSWGPGEYAAQHDVYLGTSFDDVSEATTASAAYQGRQVETTLPLDRLEFGTQYFWRIDEVNAPTDSTVFEGEIWSFTTEPIAYPVAGERITATASSASSDMEGPDNVINGSGVDANDLHSDEVTDMWLTAQGATGPAWIQFEFDKPLKLHEMWVWDYNARLEPAVGLGPNDVTIEYSTDGTEYAVLEGTPEFAQGPGLPDYTANTIVPLNGITAKYVRLAINSSW